MTRRLLDLFCGAGGAAAGYHRAGFDEIVGVDIEDQPRYPFHFVKGDATRPPVDLDAFDLIHASPPCQPFATFAHRRAPRQQPSVTPRLIASTRALLEGRPYIIENVNGARPELRHPIELTGEMFGLRVHRPRLFESPFLILAPHRPRRQRDPVAVYGTNDGRWLWKRKDGTELRVASIAEAAAALEIDWMTWEELREAIPPAYTEYLGGAFLASHR